MSITNKNWVFENRDGERKTFLEIIEDFGLQDNDEITLSQDIDTGWYFLDIPNGIDDIYTRVPLNEWSLIKLPTMDYPVKDYKKQLEDFVHQITKINGEPFDDGEIQNLVEYFHYYFDVHNGNRKDELEEE
jgi:hypothetical protein